ncbi:hypothetical protein ZIOFF_072315 [Zingiber officinale]|uniref:Uncharacterized protein n=1 Tax=Zingiber officinale TaxID=94328 RepID=A0A8J5CCP2_ZINOF|nr:hypothetical protein ZIOFF_072315 [Zingiber officinale]
MAMAASSFFVFPLDVRRNKLLSFPSPSLTRTVTNYNKRQPMGRRRPPPISASSSSSSSFRNGTPPETDCPVPFDQLPVNEYQALSTSFPFSWAAADLRLYSSRLAVTGGLFALLVGLPVSAFGTRSLSDPRCALGAASAGLLAVTLAVLRMYLGWAYVGNRLLSATVEYEETGCVLSGPDCDELPYKKIPESGSMKREHQGDCRYGGAVEGGEQEKVRSSDMADGFEKDQVLQLASLIVVLDDGCGDLGCVPSAGGSSRHAGGWICLVHALLACAEAVQQENQRECCPNGRLKFDRSLGLFLSQMIWVKTPEVLARDRLLGSFSVKPVLSRVKLTLVGLAVSLFVCALIFVNIEYHPASAPGDSGGQARAIPGAYNEESARSFEPDAFCGESDLSLTL